MEIELGVKRGAEDVGGGTVLKKAKSDVEVVGNMKKVAEMVLLLAGMGKMRGGRVPSEVEKDVMFDAREKLVEVCGCFPPKDVFPRDVFGAIIEDLGLNGNCKEQRKGFRPSIAEKFELSKRTMENFEDFSVSPSARGFAHLPTNSGVTLRVDKSSHIPVATGSFQTAAPFGHATNSSSLPYQLPTSEVRPMVSGGLPNNLVGRDPASVSILRSDRPHFKVHRSSNDPSHVSHFQAINHGGHPSVNTPDWSMQPQSVQSTSFGTKEKRPKQNVIKLESVEDVKSGIAPKALTSKPIINHTTSGSLQNQYLSSRDINTVQARMLGNIHALMCKFVLMVLQRESSGLPVWVPVSRDFMNRTLLCQICKFNINDVDSVLVCDTCEKGFHLKCLQINNPRGIPKGEWNCPKCLQLSKPLPRKYGPVKTIVAAPRVPTTTSSILVSSNKAGSMDEKINQQKTLSNGSTAKQINPSFSTVVNIGDTSSSYRGKNPSGVVENHNVAGKVGEQYLPEPSSNNNSTITAMNIASLSVPPVQQVHAHKLEQKPRPVIKSEAAESWSSDSQSQANTEDSDKAKFVHDVPPKQPCNNHIMSRSRTLNDSCRAESLCDKVTQGSEQVNSAANSTTGDISTRLERPVSDSASSVDWVGGSLEVDDNKIFYHSCSINGVVYKLQDNVLIQFPDNRVIPSKLQSLWEDNLTKSKWVTVNQYYFTEDLPEAVGRPCSQENNEVFMSTYACTAIAGMIRGPCDVLSPNKFAVEKERQTRIGTGSNDILRPLYVCRWIYDESKRLFRDLSC